MSPDESYGFKMRLFGILWIPPFANQWEERIVLRHAQIHKRMMKGDDPEIDTAHIQSALVDVWLFQRKFERLSLIVS